MQTKFYIKKKLNIIHKNCRHHLYIYFLFVERLSRALRFTHLFENATIQKLKAIEAMIEITFQSQTIAITVYVIYK